MLAGIADWQRRSMSRFQNRLVAFIDVLGLSRALSSEDGSRRYAEGIDAILSPIVRKTREPWLVLPHVHTGQEVEIDLSLPVTPNSRITTVSDAIVLSVPLGARTMPDERMRRIFGFLRACYGIQRALLALGLRSRGGASIGGLIHKNHLVVGNGLVRAHALESQTAVFPRIVIDREIIKLLIDGEMPNMALYRNRVAHIIRQDSDAAFFVDYLSHDPVVPGTRISAQQFQRIVGGLGAEIEATPPPPVRVEQKLRWMMRYIATTVSAASEVGERRTSHAELRFSGKYYRSDENVHDWVEDFTKELATRRANAARVE